MGLDMYLEGHKHLWSHITDPKKSRKEDGLPIAQIRVQLGYWRKHPNLHGYIVSQFAGGKDECQEIVLGSDQIRQIMTDVRLKNLPVTDGFFFGRSAMSDREAKDDLAIFEKALAWLEEQPKQVEPERIEAAGFTIHTVSADAGLANESRYVVYRASW